MIKLYSPEKTEAILAENNALIENVCAACGIPSAYLKAILRMELPEIDLFDVATDALVSFNWVRYSLGRSFVLDRHTHDPLRKFDSSTGYGQIFSQVAIEAILFAQRERIPVDLGITGKLFPTDPDDLRRIWRRLHRDRVFNLSCAALNILHSAWQMTGRLDFDGYSEEEKIMIFTRYNGNAKKISLYGEKAYRYYLAALQSDCAEAAAGS